MSIINNPIYVLYFRWIISPNLNNTEWNTLKEKEVFLYEFSLLSISCALKIQKAYGYDGK
jgi:hypothetical protein